MDPQTKNPLHGVTLAALLDELVAAYGWDELGQQVRIRCFQSEPSVPSSLKFLRRTPWAREKVESFYLWHLREQKRRGVGVPREAGAPPVAEEAVPKAEVVTS
jgi:uncharacterized protein (DUF2132 family)